MYICVYECYMYMYKTDFSAYVWDLLFILFDDTLSLIFFIYLNICPNIKQSKENLTVKYFAIKKIIN